MLAPWGISENLLICIFIGTTIHWVDTKWVIKHLDGEQYRKLSLSLYYVLLFTLIKLFFNKTWHPMLGSQLPLQQCSDETWKSFLRKKLLNRKILKVKKFQLKSILHCKDIKKNRLQGGIQPPSLIVIVLKLQSCSCSKKDTFIIRSVFMRNLWLLFLLIASRQTWANLFLCNANWIFFSSKCNISWKRITSRL